MVLACRYSVPLPATSSPVLSRCPRLYRCVLPPFFLYRRTRSGHVNANTPSAILQGAMNARQSRTPGATNSFTPKERLLDGMRSREVTIALLFLLSFPTLLSLDHYGVCMGVCSMIF